jgi:hypothetical protein
MAAKGPRAAGVKVLRDAAKGIMTVGTFTLPRLDLPLLNPPKSE